MAQQKIWENEYANPRLVTGTGTEAIADVERFVKWYQKKFGQELADQKVLDLGSGIGKNGNYLARLGAVVEGMDIAENAVRLANKTAKEFELTAQYRQGNIGETLPYEDNSFDIVIDATSSNSLNEAEREIFLREVNRVLRTGGIFFVRALTKDADKNAKNLLKMNPGKEKDTYILPGVALTERVWSEVDFRAYYGIFFEVKLMEKREHYTRFVGQSYKRRFLIVYLVKP